MPNQISAPFAAIIVAVILSLTAMTGLGVFDFSKSTYATVHFDGGFQRIGEIKSQSVFTEAEIRMDGKKLESGSFDHVINWLTNSAGKDLNTAVLSAGATMKAKAGVEWIGSDKEFRLASDSLNLTSTESNRIKLIDVIAQLTALEQKVKATHHEIAIAALTFGPRHNSSSFLGKILN